MQNTSNLVWRSLRSWLPHPETPGVQILEAVCPQVNLWWRREKKKKLWLIRPRYRTYKYYWDYLKISKSDFTILDVTLTYAGFHANGVLNDEIR